MPCADGAGCKVGGAGQVPSHPDSSHSLPAALGARPKFRPQGTPLSYLHRPKAPEGPSAPAPKHGATHVELSPTALRHWPCLSSRTLQIPSAPPLLHGAGCCSLPLGRFYACLHRQPPLHACMHATPAPPRCNDAFRRSSACPGQRRARLERCGHHICVDVCPALQQGKRTRGLSGNISQRLHVRAAAAGGPNMLPASHTMVAVER